MADIYDVAEIIGRMAGGFEAEVMRIVCGTPDLAEAAVKEQLYGGLSGDGSVLSPDYDSDPWFDDPESPWHGRSADYKAWKRSITPPRKGVLLGVPARAESAPNLYIDGTFYSKIFATSGGDSLVVSVQTDATTADIVGKWGENILRLGDYAIDYYTREVTGPGVWKFFEACGW